MNNPRPTLRQTFRTWEMRLRPAMNLLLVAAVFILARLLATPEHPVPYGSAFYLYLLKGLLIINLYFFLFSLFDYLVSRLAGRRVRAVTIMLFILAVLIAVVFLATSLPEFWSKQYPGIPNYVEFE